MSQSNPNSQKDPDMREPINETENAKPDNESMDETGEKKSSSKKYLML